MPVIKNFSQLALTPDRHHVLDLIEAGLAAITPEHVMHDAFVRTEDILRIQDQTFDLDSYERVFVIGFGKGSAGIAEIVEKTLLDKIADGYVIDTVDGQFSKLHFTRGTHPLPSQTNIDFTNTVLENMTQLTERDLVLVIICGGGSALFESPARISLEKEIKIFTDLLNSGATISEMNVIRKHISRVKGGGLAYALYPARVASMVFSDVPGNDLSVIASGPTVPDTHQLQDSQTILQKYHLDADLTPADFSVTPTDAMYFASVTNTIMVSNMTALTAMEKKATDLGLHPRIFSDHFQGDAKEAGKILIDETKPHEVLLVGGETTVHVVGKGKGGRNQTLVLAALPFVSTDVTIASVGTDGWDFTTFAGAIGDHMTMEKAEKMGLSPESFLTNDDSTTFYTQIGDGIDTGRLASNVSDIMIVLRQ